MTNNEKSGWDGLRAERMNEPGAHEAYLAARLAFDLGASVRQLREQQGWTQQQLAERASMTQSAVARLEAGGTTPTLPLLNRVASALEAELAVSITPRSHVA